MKKALKLFVSLLTLTLVLGAQTTARAAQADAPAYAVTDEAVIIDHVPYAIRDNTIQYEGKTYEVQENGTLITYDEDGQGALFILPLEEYTVTDPVRIAELNAGLEKSKRSAFARNIGNALTLPYTAFVSRGQERVITPVFKIGAGRSNVPNYTCLKLHDFSGDSGTKKVFHLIFSYYIEAESKWGEVMIINNKNFPSIFPAKIENGTHMSYGRFVITNLYDNPAPAHKYTIFFSNI